jgi:2,3-diketo-5-methylthio-1-phosphopentane phosphatase
MNHDEFDAHLAERELDPAFADFVDAAKARNVPIEILSDGLDYAIHNILRRAGLDSLPVISNRLQQVGDREWSLQFPNASATCRVASGTCKCARASRAQNTRKRVLLIGDGASDFCVAESADFVFAKGKLIAHCIAKKVPHASITGFADALNLLPALLSGKLVAAPRVALALSAAASI